ncbi:hypothetical protein PTTG_30694 [Puccinia triticina 1-1 BBBD Race 1]|uniref:DUF4219 domain-containing protein n=1 Tax=Puccinia triticina (isolate 1-1 / race 1 (BBBD)) TaxID=630390 RepID=A0A180FXS4_PUCT1|nr:hypothetical protein PTTG_30694 [Puccinia triticina 1-1 BBBD Race 1]
MRTYLKSKDLWEVVTGEGTNSPSKKKIKTTANILISHLSEVALQAVVTIKNEEKPEEIWNAIVDRYASSSVNNKACIWLKFMRYEYSGNLKDYLLDCQKMIRDFAIVQLGIPDDIISISILAKLSRDYWNVVDNIIMNESVIFFPSRTLQKLQELVYMRETRAVATTSTSKTKTSSKVEKDTASAYKFEASDKSKKPKPAHPCSNGKHNPLAYHPAWRCFKLSAADRDALRPADPEAHLASAKDNTSVDEASVEDDFDIVEAVAFVISLTNGGVTPVLDSGASHHMVNDLSMFTKTEELNKTSLFPKREPVARTNQQQSPPEQQPRKNR